MVKIKDLIKNNTKIKNDKIWKSEKPEMLNRLSKLSWKLLKKLENNKKLIFSLFNNKLNRGKNKLIPIVSKIVENSNKTIIKKKTNNSELFSFFIISM